MVQATRRKVLITGAAGGMGRACARLFGMTHDLVLTDVLAPALESFAAELSRDGYTVASTYVGDLVDDALLANLVTAVSSPAPFVLLHTAGLSPAMAGWRAIMSVNLVGSEKLLQAIEPVLTRGSVAVLIASSAGHMMAAVPEADALMKAPTEPGFLDRIEPLVETLGASGPGTSAIGYMMSKRATLSMCERRAKAWGTLGARIVTISPGMILTPMGRQELEQTPGASMMADMAPAERAGTATDIATAARFLASDEAAFITGCDLLVDGGATGFIRSMAG